MRVLHTGLPSDAVATSQAPDRPTATAVTSARPTRAALLVANSVFLGIPARASSGERSAARARDQTVRPSDVRRPRSVDSNETASRSSLMSVALTMNGPGRASVLSRRRHRVFPLRSATSSATPVCSHQNKSPAESLTNNGLRYEVVAGAS